MIGCMLRLLRHHALDSRYLGCGYVVYCVALRAMAVPLLRLRYHRVVPYQRKVHRRPEDGVQRRARYDAAGQHTLHAACTCISRHTKAHQRNYPVYACIKRLLLGVMIADAAVQVMKTLKPGVFWPDMQTLAYQYEPHPITTHAPSPNRHEPRINQTHLMLSSCLLLCALDRGSCSLRLACSSLMCHTTCACIDSLDDVSASAG